MLFSSGSVNAISSSSTGTARPAVGLPVRTPA
jgi:hypothetical protein